MKIIKYVQLDAKDQRPTTEFPARHGAVDPLLIEQVITRTTERVRGYDHSVFVGATSADIDTAGVLHELTQDEQDELLKTLKANKQAALNRDYEKACDQLKKGYPKSEVDSWTEQKLDAAKYRAGATDTPWLDNAVIERGVDKEKLVSLIEANALLFSKIHGKLSGQRQAQRDIIDGFNNLVDIARFSHAFSAE